jgi:hypothetical protein
VKENIYCLYDKKSQIALKPFLVHRNDVAPLRETQDVVANKDTVIHKHPQDFDLICVGEIDLESLEVTGHSPRLIAQCKDMVDEQNS